MKSTNTKQGQKLQQRKNEPTQNRYHYRYWNFFIIAGANQAWYYFNGSDFIKTEIDTGNFSSPQMLTFDWARRVDECRAVSWQSILSQFYKTFYGRKFWNMIVG